MPNEPTIADMLRDLTWDDLVADGIITLEEIEASLRAKGIEPYAGYEEMYE